MGISPRVATLQKLLNKLFSSKPTWTEGWMAKWAVTGSFDLRQMAPLSKPVTIDVCSAVGLASGSFSLRISSTQKASNRVGVIPPAAWTQRRRWWTKSRGTLNCLESRCYSTWKHSRPLTASLSSIVVIVIVTIFYFFSTDELHMAYLLNSQVKTKFPMVCVIAYTHAAYTRLLSSSSWQCKLLSK